MQRVAGAEKKNEKRENEGNLNSVSSCDDELVRVRSFATTSPVGCVFVVKTSRRKYLDFFERELRAIFHKKGSDTLSELTPIIFDFLLGERKTTFK